MQEWLNWPLSKSGMGQLIEGSNPSLSATTTPRESGVLSWRSMRNLRALTFAKQERVRCSEVRQKKALQVFSFVSERKSEAISY